ncbi:MAG TPA: Wzz/FepE/Etk N-terminal domain-containing protein [Acidobacteriota bacterium]|nr:Wzz/FepE/Etk N-terminal domain-containing protein [Acidobacteriota bacterium]
MNQNSSTNLWLFLEVLAARRVLIITLVLAGAIVSAVVSLFLPAWYEATALVFPSREMMAPVTASKNLTDIASITGGIELPVMVTPSDMYARLLKSRAVTSAIIERFDLKARYGAGSMYEANEQLLRHARFRVTEEGLVGIRVEDRDPESAATIANAFVDELNSLHQRIVSQRARRSREFIEARLAEVRTQLDETRRELEQFQIENRALDFDEQTRLAIDQAAELKVELARVDIEIGLVDEVLGSDNPQLVDLRKRRRSIVRQLETLEYGGSDSSYFSLPLAAIPGLRGTYESLLGRVEVSETVHKALLELYEQAKIQESAKSTPLSVLDRATVPEIRSRPQRTLIVLGSTGVVFVLALLLASFLAYLERLRQTRPDDYARGLRFVDAYLGWLPGVRRASRDRTP